MENTQVKTPWYSQMGDVPLHLDYFQGSMYDAVEAIAKKYPHIDASLWLSVFLARVTSKDIAQIIGQSLVIAY
ncbi:MAG: hypothetical protein II602_04110 [Erysipelotrichales bacterium]|nr:hypothetical protein [Erysipelotrichales bacterium]